MCWICKILRNVLIALIFFPVAITSNASSSGYEQFRNCRDNPHKTEEQLIEAYKSESTTAAYLKERIKKGDDGLYRFYHERFLNGEKCSNQCPEVEYIFHQCLLEIGVKS